MAPLSRLFNPTIHLLDQLRYPWKFLLISVCFALPTALLIYMLFSEIGERMVFAERERDGVVYVRALETTRQSLYQMELAADTGGLRTGYRQNKRWRRSNSGWEACWARAGNGRK
jgi:hypothetical protein